MRRPGSEECNQAAPQGVLRTAPKEGRKRPPLRGHSPRPFGLGGVYLWKSRRANPFRRVQLRSCARRPEGAQEAGSISGSRTTPSGQHGSPSGRRFGPLRTTRESISALSFGRFADGPREPWRTLRHGSRNGGRGHRPRRPLGPPPHGCFEVPDTGSGVDASELPTHPAHAPQRPSSTVPQPGPPNGHKKVIHRLVGRNRAVLPRCTSTTPDLTGTGLDTTRGARRWRSEIR